jgi:hypothetical protein
MRLLGRILSLGALTLLLVTLSASGLAAAPRDPLAGPGGAPTITLPGGAVVVGPSLVPGATVGAVGIADAYAYSSNSAADVVNMNGQPVFWEYNSTGFDILASLRLPAGATLWQIDYYGYATGATSQSWFLLDQDTTTGADTAAALPATPTGPGVLHATQSYPGGLTLASGHDWMIALVTTTSTSGYVGAIFQYTLPTVSLVPITPVRVFDSRFARFGGPIARGSSRLVNVKDAISTTTGVVTMTDAIPHGARAISFTLTITGTVGGGWVCILPGTNATATASTINWWASGQTLATGGIVSLGTGAAERQVTLVVSGGTGSRTQVIVDITGYYH